MARQTVDTGQIEAVVQKLTRADAAMDSALDTLKGKVRQVENTWGGQAGEQAMTELYRILQYGEARSTVLQNYINLLRQQVNPSYEGAEEINRSLADRFK